MVLDILLAGAFIGFAIYRAVRSRTPPRFGAPWSGLGPQDTQDRLRTLLAAASGRAARVTAYARGEMDSGVRFAIDGLARTVTIWRPGLSTLSNVAFIEARDIGEPAFDRAFRAGGPRADVLALLGLAQRAALRDLLLGSVRIGQVHLEDGTLVVDVPTAGFAREHPGLDQAAQSVGKLATLLVAPTDNLARLADNVAYEEQAEVRLQNLLALVEAYKSDPRTRSAVSGALVDRDERVRLAAALSAGAAGRATLIALALDLAVSDACAARALEALGSDLPLDRVDPLLSAAVADGENEKASPERTRAFVAALERNSSPGALDVLDRLAQLAADEYGPAVVDAVVAGDRPGAERVLLKVLEPTARLRTLTLDADRTRTREAAARRLGAIGTVEAVLALQEAAERYGGTVAAAARQSVAEIQKRLVGTRGRLALTDSEAGRLSEVEDESGRVSLPPDGD